MGKLIKYELRKQRTSRLVILAALAVGLLTFWGGLLFDNSNVMGVTIALMFGAAILVLFYTGIEGVLVLNRDLRTRQSYMLWISAAPLPRSPRSLPLSRLQKQGRPRLLPRTVQIRSASGG